jgi:predicted dehydrogenase
MIAAATASGTALAVGHFRRFFWSCRAIKQIIDIGMLGRVQSFTFLEGETYSWPAASASFFDRKQAGGGVLIDAGAHMIDLLLWWLGDVEEVEYADDAMGGVEANCVMHLRMKSGASGTVQLSRDWPLPNRYVIECENGWLTYVCDVVDRIEYGFRESNIGFDAQLRTVERSPLSPHVLGGPAPDFMRCFDDQLRHLVAAVRTNEPVAVSGVEARKTVAFIERCYRDRQPLSMPWLDSSEQRRARELANV